MISDGNNWIFFNYRFEYCDALRAFFKPYFLLSLILESLRKNKDWFKIGRNSLFIVQIAFEIANWIASRNFFGINDVFEIKGTGIYEYELIIFDKWGGIIFQSIDPKQAWTGGIDGYFVPDGVYTYTLKALDIEGVPLIGNGLYFGSVLVMR